MVLSSTAPASSVRFPCAVCGGGDVASVDLSGFELKSHFSLQSVCMQEFKCPLSGVTVFLCGTQSPLSHLFVTLKTETHTHEGLPHALEHLVFLGSKHYPYKGFLDIVATRGFSQGTNAWTATDHTTYTLATAGSEVYLDHIFLPTLSEDAFLTEVHHFKANGTSAGVVYSEMEARERTASSQCDLKMSERLYPGDSGYKFETGGLLRCIRATSNARIRAYHRLFYKLDNAAVIVVGRVDRNELLPRLREAVSKILQTSRSLSSEKEEEFLVAASPPPASPLAEADPDFQKPLALRGKPWSSAQNVVRPSQTSLDAVLFPCDDEKLGRVAIGFRGPGWSDMLLREAVGVLGSYYTESNAALLQRELVQSATPVCSSVQFHSQSFKETSVVIEALDVPLESRRNSQPAAVKAVTTLPGRDAGFDVVAKIKELLNAEAAEGAASPLDMKRLHTIIRRELHQFYEALETGPQDILVEALNEYFLYGGEDGAVLAASLDQGSLSRELLRRDASFWREVLRRVFVDSPSAGVVAVPSKAEAERLQKKDEEDATAVVQRVGADALKSLAAKVDEIKKTQTQQPPSEAVQAVPVARLENVRLLKVDLIANFRNPHVEGVSTDSRRQIKRSEESFVSVERRVQRGLTGDRQSAPWVLVSHIDSHFVGVRVCLRLPFDCSFEDKQRLLVLADLLFESDVRLPKHHAEILFEMSGEDFDAAEEEAGLVRIAHGTFTKLLLGVSTDFRAGMGFGADSSAGYCAGSSSCEILCVRGTASKENAVALAVALQAAAKGAVFTRERVEVILKKHAKQLAGRMRKGEFLLQQISSALWLERNSTLDSFNAGKQRRVIKKMLDAPEETVQDLRRLYKQLLAPSRMFLHFVADVAELSKIPWKGGEANDWLGIWDGFRGFVDEDSGDLENKQLLEDPFNGLRLPSSQMTRLASSKEGRSFRLISGLSSGGSSYLRASVLAPHGFRHDEVAGLFVLCECLSMTEGTLYRVVRGAGHAYGCDISYSPWNSRLTLTLAPATDVVAAFQASLDAFRLVIDGEPLSVQEIEAAKCGVLFSVVRDEGTLVDAAVSGAELLLESLPPEYNAFLLKRVAQVTSEEVQALAKKYLKRFLESFGAIEETEESRVFSTLSVVTRMEKVQETLQKLQEMGVTRVAVASPSTLRKFLSLETDEEFLAFFSDDANYDAKAVLNAETSDSEEAEEAGWSDEDDDDEEDDDDDVDDDDDDDDDDDEEDGSETEDA